MRASFALGADIIAVDVSAAAIKQLTSYQRGLMRPLCFLAAQPALSHPAAIAQWLSKTLPLTEEHASLDKI